MCHGNEFLLLELPLDPMDIAGRSFLELVNDSLPAVHCDPEGSRKRELVSNLGDLLHHGRGPPINNICQVGQGTTMIGEIRLFEPKVVTQWMTMSSKLVNEWRTCQRG